MLKKAGRELFGEDGVMKEKKHALKKLEEVRGAEVFDLIDDANKKEEPAPQVFSIGQFIEILNTFFRRDEVKITGEVCELKRAASGHVYFTLKDKSKDGASAVMDAIIWKRTYDVCGIDLEVGMEVILTGHPNIYAASGRLSFIADAVELVGEGALKKAYEALKAKLQAQGFFDAARKRALPELPQRIGVVTSLKGAVIHDFENNLGKFGFVVKVCDSRVEGQAAVKDLLASVAAMRTLADEGALDALVIIRGGGSLESLQGFNNEALVRAVVDFPVPVIAGIGHDQDVPLVALAADYMTSTPTAAAHLLNRSWEEAYAKLHRLASIFVRLQQELRRRANELDNTWMTVLDRIERRIAWMTEQIDYTQRFIRLNDPRRQLALGYSLTRKNGKIVRSAKTSTRGDKLETEFADGSVKSRVE